MERRNLIELIESIQRRQCEEQTVEVKAATQGAPKVYDTLSSFANQSDGGVIVFGLDENSSFAAVGVYDPQALQKAVAEQAKEIEPSLSPVFEVVEYQSVVIVGCYVAGLPMGQRPAYRRTAGITKGSYVRVGDQDLHMGAPELYEIEAFKNGARDDLDVSPISSIDMLSDDFVAKFVLDAKAERPHLSHRSADEVLSLSGAVRNGAPTLAGMLALSDYPQQAYPNLCVTAVAVVGTELGQDERGSRFLDNKRFEGTIGQMVEDALAFVRRNTRTRTVVIDGKREDVPEYPENAVREVIANSLMHRDYGPYSNGTPTRLMLFSDRLEVWNPGGIYGGQSVEDLGYVNVQTRNPTLVSILEIQGVAENRHSGIPVIRDEMRRAGLRPPVFRDVRGTFTAQLFNEPEEMGHEDVAVTAGGVSLEEILAFCSVPRSRREVAEHFGIGVSYMGSRYLNPLVADGKLAMTIPEKPKSKNQRFVATRGTR